jgi:hypothetical protein
LTRKAKAKVKKKGRKKKRDTKEKKRNNIIITIRKQSRKKTTNCPPTMLLYTPDGERLFDVLNCVKEGKKGKENKEASYFSRTMCSKDEENKMSKTRRNVGSPS